NRGIGRAICEVILSRKDPGPLTLFATSRKGEDLAFNSSRSDLKVVYPKLDISCQDSIHAFKDIIKSHTDTIDVLINNGGINVDRQYNLENAKKTLDVNYRGTLQMCQFFLPHLAKTGRIVNLASIASNLKIYSPEIQARFREAKTLGDLEQIAQDYLTAVRDGTEESSGFGATGRSYCVSKALVRAFTKILSRHHQQGLINCCCPGWVSTDMGVIVGKRPPKTPEQGAMIPVHLAFDDIGDVTGEYFANDSVRSKGLGKVQAF
ncbi:uncharacterized protein MYCFIDRAFT_41956, partial [Pseudocercospora fijiensis CIRAD86]